MTAVAVKRSYSASLGQPFVAVPMWLINEMLPVLRVSDCNCSEDRDDDGRFIGHNRDDCPRYWAKHLARVKASNAATVVADSNGEIRSDSDGAVDEIVASDVARFHLERMDGGHWWMRLDLRDGSGLVVNLATKRNAAISALAEREPARDGSAS